MPPWRTTTSGANSPPMTRAGCCSFCVIGSMPTCASRVTKSISPAGSHSPRWDALNVRETGRALMRVAIAAATMIRIPAEDLDTALRTFEKDSGLELIFVAEDVRGVRTRGANGDLTVEETLNR